MPSSAVERPSATWGLLASTMSRWEMAEQHFHEAVGHERLDGQRDPGLPAHTQH